MAASGSTTAARTADRVPATAVMRRTQKRQLRLYLWVLPALLFYGLFKIVPLIGGLVLSLFRWDGVADPVYVGLLNFQRMFADEKIIDVLQHNIQYAFGTVIGKIVLSLFLALLLNQALRGRAFYRTALFTPVIMSFVVVSLLWTWLFNDQFGLINNMLRLVGLGSLAINWLGDANNALNSLIIVDIWKWYGFHMVIFLAGLQTIPQELYEAARVDGANRWQQFRRLTLPLLRPVMAINITLSLLGAFNVFEIPYIMTEGGPANATNVLALHAYLQGFKFYKLGYGAALNYGIMLLVTVIALIQLRLSLAERDSEIA